MRKNGCFKIVAFAQPLLTTVWEHCGRIVSNCVFAKLETAKARRSSQPLASLTCSIPIPILIVSLQHSAASSPNSHSHSFPPLRLALHLQVVVASGRRSGWREVAQREHCQAVVSLSLSVFPAITSALAQHRILVTVRRQWQWSQWWWSWWSSQRQRPVQCDLVPRMYATGSRNRTTETATENEANASQSHVHVASSLSHSHFLTFLCLLESPYIHCNIESIFGHRQRQPQHYRRALQLHLPLDLQSWRDFLSLTLSLAHSLPFSHLLFLSFSPTLLFLYQLLQTHTD